MTRRRRHEEPSPTASFTWGNIVNLGGIPFITAVFFFVGNWFVNGDTVKRHDIAIKEFVTTREEEKKAREGVRNEFLQSQSKLIEVLGRLDTRLSVGEKQTETIARQVEKLTDSLVRPTQPQRFR